MGSHDHPISVAWSSHLELVYNLGFPPHRSAGLHKSGSATYLLHFSFESGTKVWELIIDILGHKLYDVESYIKLQAHRIAFIHNAHNRYISWKPDHTSLLPAPP